MSRPVSPNDIVCKDGTGFTVARKCGAVTVLVRLLAERADALNAEADHTRALSARLRESLS